LCGCGVSSDPEKGPVILLCEGQKSLAAANGEHEKERKREFYRIDGVEHTLQQWDDENQTFGVAIPGLTISGTEMRYSRQDPVISDISSMRVVTFDRVTGRVTDEFLMSNGGAITFEASCKPIKSVADEKKF
jgi:hypothetical protein